MALPFFLTRFLLLIPVLAILSSCSTDFDPNADYKEIPIIYTILDPTETTHYVKVNKAFLNTGSNALTIAANNPDSTTYEDIKVELLKVRDNRDSAMVQSYTLERITVTDKEPGDFYHPEQELYKIDNVALDENFLYRVRVTNNKSGLVAYGTTSLIKPFCARGVGHFSFTCEDTSNTIEFKPEEAASLRYYTSPNARIYKITAYFTFTEVLDGNSETKTVRWDITSNEVRLYDPQNFVAVTIEKDAFLKQMVTLLKPENDPPTLRRIPGELSFVITAGSDELATYYEVNNAFSVFSQTIPEYDNVVNGTGLVASRRKIKVDAFISIKSKEYISERYPQLKFQ